MIDNTLMYMHCFVHCKDILMKCSGCVFMRSGAVIQLHVSGGRAQ